MKYIFNTIILATTIIVIGTLVNYAPDASTVSPQVQNEEKEKSGFLGRSEYFKNMLKDPETGLIPRGIRSSELNHAETLPTTDDLRFKQSSNFDFTEIGPNDVGGRTRALAVDVSNSNIIIAGGVSGGIWKSTDAGQSWSLKSRPDQIPHVTSLAQDPRPGNTNTWYYSTGEFSGNSADGPNGSAFYNGRGIYKSTDNGETWDIIPSTDVGDLNSFDSPYDYVSKIVVNPVTGTVYFAGNFSGIYRSTDGLNFASSLGPNDHTWSDIAAATDGTLYATLSDNQNGAINTPGLYRSTDDGLNWNRIPEVILPAGFGRSTLAVSPSNKDIVYIFYADVNNSAGIYYADILNPANNENRTQNIPDYGDPVGDLDLQGQYNMVSIVKPDDPDHIVVGGTNAFRSTDGFGSVPSTEVGWVGGYSRTNNISQYDEHHPDQHVMFYDPSNPNRLYSGHDGGISVTENSTQVPLVWTDLNNGYNVTQFYHVSIHPDAGDVRIMGGTQDNGTPFFRFDTDGVSSASNDASSGDGAFSALRNSFGIVSSQNGVAFKWEYQPNGDLQQANGAGIFTRVDPQGCVSSNDPAVDQRNFIHPFVVDYGNENVMFFPCQSRLYRNTDLTSIPDFDQDPATEGWAQVANFSLDGREISSIEVSQTNPSNVLYVAGFGNGTTPVIKRLDNATVGTGSVDISIAELPADAYINDLAVNPKNGAELIAVISNYGVESVFYSNDSGSNWTSIEGNLAGISPNQEGPSARTAAIAQIDDQNKKYFVGTSTGLYSTTLLDGNNTIWVRESSDIVGLSLVSSLEYRSADNVLAIATHGRGIFLGELTGAVSNEEDMADIPMSFGLDQNYPNPFNPSTNIQFSLSQHGQVTLTIYDLNGRKVSELINNESYSSGTHSVNFNATNLASGMYIYNIRAISPGGISFTQSRTMTLIK